VERKTEESGACAKKRSSSGRATNCDGPSCAERGGGAGKLHNKHSDRCYLCMHAGRSLSLTLLFWEGVAMSVS
jgi:hypothetical protein